MGHVRRLTGKRIVLKTWAAPPPPNSGIIFATAKVYLEEDPREQGALAVVEASQEGPNTYFLGYESHGITIVDHREAAVSAAWDVLKLNHPGQEFMVAFGSLAAFRLEYEGNRVTKLTLFDPLSETLPKIFPGTSGEEKTLLLAIVQGYDGCDEVDWEFYGPAEPRPGLAARIWRRMLDGNFYTYVALINDNDYAD